MGRGRNKNDVTPNIRKLSLTGEIELLVQMIGWDESRMLQSIGNEYPSIIEDDYIRHQAGGMSCEYDEKKRKSIISLIRVARSKFAISKKDQKTVDDIMGRGEVVCFDDIEADPVERITSGLRQIDDLYGYTPEYETWGLPRGQVSLMAGAPGVGKSRLMTSVCGHMTHPENDCGFHALYFQAEYALAQFKQMNKDIIVPNARFLCGDLVHMQDQVDFIDIQDIKPDLVVIDSVQMLAEAKSTSGIERCIAFYKNAAMEHGYHVCFITQLNKAGEVAGSRAIEHLVDQVFTVKHSFHHGQFGIKITKNRWGISGISAKFEHTAKGVVCVSEGLDRDKIVNLGHQSL